LRNQQEKIKSYLEKDEQVASELTTQNLKVINEDRNSISSNRQILTSIHLQESSKADER